MKQSSHSSQIRRQAAELPPEIVGTVRRYDGSRLGRASIALLLGVLSFLLVALATAGAQCIVQNPSFENVTSTSLPTPGWSPSVTSETPIPGIVGWFTRLRGPDIFWPSANVPNNFMTSSPLYPFDGKIYAGISSGRFTAGYLTEILAGALTASPVGQMYEVRARFAMGTLRNSPVHVMVSLDGPSGSYFVGYTLVNSPNWTLFSKIINIPSGNYNRIVFTGVDSMPRYGGGYAFIDSVDICAASPCNYLGAHLQYNNNANGSCCWNLIVDNNVTAAMPSPFRVRVTTQAPAVILGATAATGWAATPSLPQSVTWGLPSNGVMSTGSGQFVGTFCVQTNGALPQQHIIEFLDRGNKTICTDTLYTDCHDKPPVDCMTFSQVSITCGPHDAAGNQTYNVNFVLTNNSGVAGGVQFTSPTGTITPSAVVVGVGNTPISLTYTNLSPGGVACLYTALHVRRNGNGIGVDSIVCRDSVCTDLPHCAEDCCSGFLKRFDAGIKYVNGSVSLSGCVAAGPGTIKRFSATIVAVATRTVCGGSAGGWVRAFGDIIGGSLSAALPGPVLVAGAPFSREAVWGGMNYPNCVDLTKCTPYSLKMIFPAPPVGRGCRDTLRFSVRYSFTDCKCLTCDTVITYTVVRGYTWLPWTDVGTAVDLSHAVARANSALLNITMTSAEEGTLNVTLPKGDDNPTHIRIVGLAFQPDGVGLKSLRNSATMEEAPISGNTAMPKVTLEEGSSALYALTYANGDGNQVIGNTLRFRYVLVDDTADTLESDDVNVEAYTPAVKGGDSVKAPPVPPVSGVRTYALHINASNKAGESVQGIRLQISGNAMLIAVGPVGDGHTVEIAPGVDGKGNAVVQLADGTWEIRGIASADSLQSVYLTFANAENGVTVDYNTVGASGAVLTHGMLALMTPIAGVMVPGEDAESGAALQPVYPNPTAGAATAQFSLRGASSVTLSLRDLRGIEVARQIDRARLEPGEHAISLATTGLPQGTYLVVLDVDGRIYTRPLQVVR